MENSNNGGKWYNSVPLAILVAGLIIAGAVLYIGGTKTASIGDQTTPVPTPVVIKDPSTLVAPNDPVLGDANAPVTVVEFSDFQCPYCRAFFIDTFTQLKKDYIDTGKVRLVFRDFPLPFHPAAEPAAEAGQCANDQGKFWEFHDKVFSEQQKKEPDTSVVSKTIDFTVADIKTWASQIGLDMAKFNQCLDSGQHKDDVQNDIQVGTTATVDGTPSFFINGHLLVGAQAYAVFKQMMDQELAK